MIPTAVWLTLVNNLIITEFDDFRLGVTGVVCVQEFF